MLLQGADADLTADGRLDALHRGREPGHGRHARHTPPDRRRPDLVAVQPDRRRGRRDSTEGRVHDQVYLTVEDAGDNGRLAVRTHTVTLLSDDFGTNAVSAQYLRRSRRRPDLEAEVRQALDREDHRPLVPVGDRHEHASLDWQRAVDGLLRL